MTHSISRRAFLDKISMGTAIVLLNPLDLFATQQRKLGVVLVGLGRYSTGQLGPALKQTKYCQLAGVVTGSKEKGEQWARDHGFSSKNIYSYETMHQMEDNKEIDIIYIVTPNGLHMEHAIAAAKTGKHVIVEKPMANTVAECDAIIAACKKANVKLSMGYRLHFDPYHMEMMRLAKDKDFGPFTKMTGDRGLNMQRKVWRADKKLAGGGPMMDLGVYIIQGACMAAQSAPVFVTAKEHVKTKPEMFTDVEEGMDWTMEFSDGAVCSAKTTYTRSADVFKAEGPKGWYEWKEHAFTYRGMVVDSSKGPIVFTPPNQQALQLDDFAQCVMANKESIIPGEMGRRDLAIVEASYEAMRTGKKVKVRY